MAVYLLDNDKLWFPHPSLGNEDGAIAMGGDLSVERLMLAYSNGIFPWYAYKVQDRPVWYCPLDRFVLFPDEIHVSHSMRTLLSKGRYEFTFNTEFRRVMEECMKADGRDKNRGSWLGPHMIEAYSQLHALGHAASVEVWEKPDEHDGERKLVGGLYGVMLKNAFFGESMFSLVPSASKMALIHLAKTASANGWHFIDCQFETTHLKSMGGRHITYDEYMGMLNGK